MTGVKTSKGCIICRRRKKGCDQVVPFCGQCLAAGIVCLGYSSEYVWVNNAGTSRNVYSKALYAAQKRNRGPSNITLHDSLTRTAREIKYIEVYWGAYLPNGKPVSVSAMRLSTIGWTQFFEELCQADSTLRYTTLALSISIIGARDGHAQLSMKGLEAYGMAIREMKRSLLDPLKRHGDGLLAAVRIMRLFETIFGGTRGDASKEQSYSGAQMDGYYGHSDGEVALVLEKGPWGVQSGPAFWLFADTRLNSIISCTALRQACVFSHPQWKTVPWQFTKKSPMDKLVDVMADIPGILEKLDVIRKHLSADVMDTWAACRQLLSECQAVETGLRAWQKEFKARIEAYDYTLTGIPPPEPAKDEDFTTVHISCMYWSVRILLFSAIRACERGLDLDPRPGTITPVGTFPPTAGLVGGPKELDILAYRIARAAPLLYSDGAGTYGSVASLFPVGVALQYLNIAESISGSSSEERGMLLDIMKKPFLGSFVGRFLNNLQHRAVRKDDGKVENYSHVEKARVWLYGSKAKMVADQ